MSKFNPTPEQTEAIRLSELGRTMKLIAYAGAGKTATLVLIAKELAKTNKKGLYLAFNKAIADEAGRKLPATCEARTFHSLALSKLPNKVKNKIAYKPYQIPKGYIKLDLDSFENHIAQDLQDLTVTGKSIVKGGLVEKQLNKSKQFMIVKQTLKYFMRDDSPEPELAHVKRAIFKELQINIEENYLLQLANPFLEYAQKIWADYQSVEGRFCIGHDVYLKLYAMSNPTLKTDYILFDEAQDADPLMLHILKAQKAQVIYVGDPHQQIYEWRGAVNAMQSINAPFSYLTKSFRFGSAVGRVANIFLQYLNEKNPLRHNELIHSSVYPLSYHQANAVLCRTNSGAIEACIEALEAGVDDINLQLSNIKQLKELISDIDGFTRNPRLYKEHYLLRDFESEKDLSDYCANADDVNPDIAKPYRLYKKYGYDTLMHVFNSCKRNNNAKLCIMTVHSSKGREWNNVILFDDFEGVSFSVTREKDSSKILSFDTSPAEARLMYVAVTRAKLKLDSKGINIVLEQLQAQDSDSYELTAPPRDIELPTKQPKQVKKDKEHAEKIRQRKAREGQKKAMAQGVEFGRPKIPVDKYLEKYSEVVEAVEAGGLTNKEIATLTGASVATVKRVKQKMKKAKA